jgi:hypothetical protein
VVKFKSQSMSERARAEQVVVQHGSVCITTFEVNVSTNGDSSS